MSKRARGKVFEWELRPFFDKKELFSQKQGQVKYPRNNRFFNHSTNQLIIDNVERHKLIFEKQYCMDASVCVFIFTQLVHCAVLILFVSSYVRWYLINLFFDLK